MAEKIFIKNTFIRDCTLTIYEKTTYMNLAMDLGRENERFVTQEGLAKNIGVSVPTVRSALRSLKTKGYIDYVLSTIPGKGRGYTYRILKYEYMLGD